MVLFLLETPRFTVRPTTDDLPLRAVFLVALATDHRVYQLSALLRAPEFTRWAADRSAVTLVPRPSFLAKNERGGHRVGPVTIPAWRMGQVPHPLYPVAALEDYLEATRDCRAAELWVHPDSLAPLGSRALGSLLVRLVAEAEPEADLTPHQVRKYASSLAFFRSFDVDPVRRAGQWSSSRSFVLRYLVPLLAYIPCVAMGVGPGP